MAFLPADFDAQKYLQLNPDLVAAYGAGNTAQATNHWLNWGQAEGRNYGAGAGVALDFWSGSDKSPAEIARLKSLGYAHPETFSEYGPGSSSWAMYAGVAPSSSGWIDYIRRTQAGGQAEAARQAAASGDDGILGFGSIVDAVALAAAAYFTAGAALGAEGGIAAAAEYGFPSYIAGSAEAVSAAAGSSAAVSSAAAYGISDATRAAFQFNGATTLDLYNGATLSAVNTSVADYAAAAVSGQSVGASSAFDSLMVGSAGGALAASGPTLLELASAAGQVAKIATQAAGTAATVMQIANRATGQRATVPVNAPVPAGWAVDRAWSPAPEATAPVSAPAAPRGISNLQGLAMADPTQFPVMPASSGTASPLLAIAVLIGALLYFGK